MESELFLIKRMNVNNYYERWRAIRAIYKPLLDEGSVGSKIKYTTHNYSTHCVNIYNIINNIIIFRDGRNLSPTEAFILNVSVILHDIIMSFDIEKRSSHAKEAYNYILENINSLRENTINMLLTQEEARYVAYTILGHSDFKGESTLKYLTNIYEKYSFNCIKFPYLAAMLRLGDELDCSRSRINRPIGTIGFTDSDDDKNSRLHYRKLELIEMVGIKEKPTNILYLYVEDRVLSSNILEDAKILSEVRSKILSEISNIKRNVYSMFCQEESPMKMFDDVKIVTNNSELENILITMDLESIC